MPESPTLQDIAKHIGLGKSTVQRVLAGIGSSSLKTRKKVNEAVAKLGYRPNPLFSSLGAKKSRRSVKQVKIAYIYRKACFAGTDYFEAAIERGTALGYNVELIELAELSADMRLMDVLYHRGYAGAIVGRIPANDHPAILANTRLPVVCCGRIATLPLHTVHGDTVELARLAWNSMIEAGYRRIGVAMGVHTGVVTDDLDRFGIILQCQMDSLPVKDHIPPLRAPLRDYKSLLEWFHKYKPDAVLGLSNALYCPLNDAGVDMSRIGFASFNYSFTTPLFAGVVASHKSVAREAVNLLDQLIRHNSVGVPDEPLHILVPGCWVDGASLPRKRPSTPCQSKSANTANIVKK